MSKPPARFLRPPHTPKPGNEGEDDGTSVRQILRRTRGRPRLPASADAHRDRDRQSAHHHADDEHAVAPPRRGIRQGTRSEEHTSELQSLMRISYAVFCLKKKKN